jgi:hypothetical protein
MEHQKAEENEAHTLNLSTNFILTSKLVSPIALVVSPAELRP